MTTFACKGAKPEENVDAIIDMRSKTDMREILHYKSAHFMTCTTKAGIIHADRKQEQHMVYIIKSDNGERIDYEVEHFDMKVIDELICDHPGEGYILIKGKDSGGKAVLMMLDIQTRDPLNLIYTRFNIPFNQEIQSIKSSRYEKYFILTFTDKKGSKKYMLINPRDKQLRFKAKGKESIKFYAKKYKGTAKTDHLEVVIASEPKARPGMGFNQKMKFNTFNKTGYYDLGQYLNFRGPVESLKLESGSLSDKVKLYKEKRIEFKNDISSITLPTAQVTKFDYSQRRWVVMRSNEFETIVSEVTKANGINKIFSIEESCEEMSFSMLNGRGSVYLSCPTSQDIIVHVMASGTDKLIEDGFQFMPASLTSSVVHLGDRVFAVAKSYQRTEGTTTIKFQRYTSLGTKGGLIQLKPDFKNEIQESKN